MFVLREDLPDGFGQLTGEVDPGHLGATLTAEALLGPLVPLAVADVAGGVRGCLDQCSAQVLGAVLGERPADVLVVSDWRANGQRPV